MILIDIQIEVLVVTDHSTDLVSFIQLLAPHKETVSCAMDYVFIQVTKEKIFQMLKHA